MSMRSSEDDAVAASTRNKSHAVGRATGCGGLLKTTGNIKMNFENHFDDLCF